MISYYRPIYDGQNILSCDNVRLNIKFKSLDCVNDFVVYLSELESSFYSKLYSSYKDFSYKYLFVFGSKGHSFSIGVCLNGCSENDNLKGFIDFNPNKILGDIVFQDGFVYASGNNPFQSSETFDLILNVQQAFEAIFWKFRYYAKRIEVARFDVALDVPVVRNKVQLIKDNRMYSQFFKSQFNYTEYLGSPSSVGRVKVYNKSIESDLGYDLTRIELTCGSFDYDELYKKFPRVFIHQDIKLDKTNILVQLLEELPSERRIHYLNQMSQNTRYKYRDLLLTEPVIISNSSWNKLVDLIQSEWLVDCINFS